MWEHGKIMLLPPRSSESALIHEAIILPLAFAVLLFFGACTHSSQPVEHSQLDPQCVLLVSECAIRGNVEEDFLRVQLINTGDVAFSVPTTGRDRELFVDPVEIQVNRWADGRFCAVSNYWQLPSFGGGEVGLRRLSPGQMVTGTLKLKQGAQHSLKDGRYFGVLRYDLGTWADPLAVPEIDKLHLTACFLFDVGRTGVRVPGKSQP
jgi:hypothetical protein